MCIILIKRKEQTFEPELIERMYDMGNKDGFGMMWWEEGRVKTEKSTGFPYTLKKLYKDKMDNDIAVHVRNATFGAKNLENCHPYCVLDMDLGHKIDLYMMHNGTIREVQIDKTMSDSYNFATKFLRPLLAKANNYKMIYDEDFQNFLAGIVGPNKLVFLDNKKQFIIVNSDLGSYHASGCWVSTKNKIEVLPPYVVHHTNSHQQSTTTPLPPWEFAKGEWVTDADMRLHFHAETKPSKPEDEEAADTTIDTAGTDNGIHPESDDVDEEGLEEIFKRIPTMQKIHVFSFVTDYHSETLSLLMKYVKDADLDQMKKLVKSFPWETTDQLIKIATEKHGHSVQN